MLDHTTQVLIDSALKLPVAQQFQLIDAILNQGDPNHDLHADAPPLAEGRLDALVQEGKQAVERGQAKTFQAADKLADHVGNIFDQAIQQQAKPQE